MPHRRCVWLVITSREARLLGAQRCLEAAAAGVGAPKPHWSHVYSTDVTRRSSEPLGFLGLFDAEQQLQLSLVGEASVARRYPREGWVSARKDYLCDMQALSGYQQYIETFGAIERENQRRQDAFDDHPDGVSEFICLLGDFDDALAGVNGSSVAKQMELARNLMARFLDAGDEVGLVLDDDKALAPVVALVGARAPLPRHIASRGFWTLARVQMPIEALDGEIRGDFHPGDALRLLAVQGIEDGDAKGIWVHILVGGESYSVLLSGINFGRDDSGTLEIYSDAKILLEQLHACLAQNRSEAMSNKMMSILATSPSENPQNVWQDVWKRVAARCVVAEDEECLQEDVACRIAPHEVFGEPAIPLDPEASRGSGWWVAIRDGVKQRAAEGASAACHRAIERLTAGPGGGAMGFGSLALVLYLLLGSLLFASQIVPLTLGVGAVATDGVLYLRRGDRASLVRGGCLMCNAGVGTAAYLYQSITLALIFVVQLGAILTRGRHPRVVWQEQREALAARAATLREALPPSVADFVDRRREATAIKLEEARAMVQELRFERGRVGGAVASVASGGKRAVASVASGGKRAVGGVASGVGYAVGGVAGGIGKAGRGIGRGASALVKGTVAGTSRVVRGAGGGVAYVARGGASGVGRVLKGGFGVIQGTAGAIAGVVRGAASGVASIGRRLLGRRAAAAAEAPPSHRAQRMHSLLRRNAAPRPLRA